MVKPVKHEAYTVSIIKVILNDLIDNHKELENLGIKANTIAGLIEGKGVSRQILLWKDIVS